MKITSTLCIAFTIIASAVDAQQYWQQEVNYTIAVKLNDELHELTANESIQYVNHSPFALTEIWFHLWPNAYSTKETALAKQLLQQGKTDFYYAKESEMGNISGLDFKVNGQAIKVEMAAKIPSIGQIKQLQRKANGESVQEENNPDVCKLILNEPLAPGAEILITTPFVVKLPNSYSRLGHVGEAYQITQWYPKPAVYDESGWHVLPYLDQGEFYSEYGSFDVKITLPENYVVGATGDLQNEEEIAWLTAKADSTARESLDFGKNMDFPASSKKEKTLHYTQKNVHDFAWFADKRFHVLKGEVELPHSKRKVTTWAMFTNAYANYWKNGSKYIADATYYYSLWNGDYRYNQVTAVDGALSAGGGMEYPNVTVIGPVSSDLGLETVIMHEVGHNWFYGMLGSNEREYGWMDEGINTYNEQRYIQTKYPDTTLANLIGLKKAPGFLGLNIPAAYNSNALLYQLVASKHVDQAIGTPSADFTSINYGAIMYGKTGLVFRYLASYLGQDVFDKCMQAYFDKWVGKHPQPGDMYAVFEEVSGKKLDWFFRSLLNTNAALDFKIKKLKYKKGELDVQVENKAPFLAPVDVAFYDKKDSLLSIYKGREFPAKETFGYHYTKEGVRKVVIDPDGFIPELNRSNNRIRTTGLFKRMEPLSLKFFGGLERADKTQLFVLPAIAYNYNDGLMAGIALYNHALFAKRFEWEVAPLYSAKLNQVNGIGGLRYNWYPHAGQRITLALGYQKFTAAYRDNLNYTDISGTVLANGLKTGYQRINPSIDWMFKPSITSSIKQHIGFKATLVLHDETFLLGNNSTSYLPYSAIPQSKELFNEMYYQLQQNRVINPYTAALKLQQGAGFMLATAQAAFKFNYTNSKKKAEIRLFAGQYLYNNSADGRFRMYYSQNPDYLFEHLLLDRARISKSFMDKQLVSDAGGFKQFTTAAGANRWLLSVNEKVPAPFKLPVGIYAGQGLSSADSKFYYEAGLYVPIVRDLLEVYFPVKTSSDLSALTYGERIRYVLHIEKMNPFRLLNRITE